MLIIFSLFTFLTSCIPAVHTSRPKGAPKAVVVLSKCSSSVDSIKDAEMTRFLVASLVATEAFAIVEKEDVDKGGPTPGAYIMEADLAAPGDPGTTQDASVSYGDVKVEGAQKTSKHIILTIRMKDAASRAVVFSSSSECSGDTSGGAGMSGLTNFFKSAEDVKITGGSKGGYSGAMRDCAKKAARELALAYWRETVK